jgi:uncharacterized protein (TIGR03435 family)
MKPEEKNVEEVLKQYWSSAPQEEAEADCNRVLHRLRAAAEHAPKERRPGFGFLSFFGTRMGMISAAAAVILVVVLGTTMVQRHRAVAVVDKSGAAVSAGEIVRADVDGRALVLTDGSRVEMRAQSELVLERADDGMRIRLNEGSVIVNAAKQHGHLYVQTKDVTVSVVGTLFLVNADDKGSRVAVMEGEVRVQQGTVEKSLRPGEQVASNPKSPALEADRQLFRETGWSPEAYASLAKLQESMAQSLAARQTQERAASVSDKPKFEEASIRPCDNDLPAVEGIRGGGGNAGTIRLTPGRLDVQCMTVNTMISLARPFLKNNPRQLPANGLLSMNGNPSFTPEDQTRVRSGPDWVRSERYTIAAVGDSTDAPTLQVPMLMDLIERRFNLRWRVETEEIPVYELSIAKGGLKIKPIEMDSGKYEEFRKIRASLPPQRGRNFEMVMLRDEPTYAGLLGCSYGPPPNPSVASAQFREALRRDGKPPVCGFHTYVNGRSDAADARALGPNVVVNSGASPISLLADSLSNDSGFRSLAPAYLRDTLNGLLVVDKTGLPDTNCLTAIPSAGTPCAPLFNYFLEYAIDESNFTSKQNEKNGSFPKAPNIFKALEKLGLQLEKTKARREFIVIEHIERPSEN